MEIIQGFRSSAKLYVYDEQIYKVNRIFSDKLYLKCHDRGCRGKGQLVGEVFHLTTQHSHPPDSLKVKQLKFKQGLRSAAAGQIRKNKTLRTVFDSTCNEHQDVARFTSYSQSRGLLQRARQNNKPPNPQNLREYGELLSDYRWKKFGETNGNPPQPFFIKHIEHELQEWEAVLFVSPTLKGLLQTTECLHIDATFKAVPQGLGYQLLTIHALHMDHVFPVVYTLMSRKSEEAYLGVFNEVAAMCPNSLTNVKTIMTDFELGLMNAAKTVWSEASIKGCFFHFAQAVFRHHATLGLSNRTRVIGNDKKLLKMLMTLCLLPPEEIKDGLTACRNFAAEQGINAFFEPMFNYMTEFWLNIVGIQRISVFDEFHRTNNTAEAFYSYLNQKLGGKKGVWTFTENLIEIDHCKSLDYERLLNGLPASRRIRNPAIQNKKIKKLWTDFKDGRLNVAYFLNKSSHVVDNFEGLLQGVLGAEGLANLVLPNYELNDGPNRGILAPVKEDTLPSEEELLVVELVEVEEDPISVLQQIEVLPGLNIPNIETEADENDPQRCTGPFSYVPAASTTIAQDLRTHKLLFSHMDTWPECKIRQ